MNDKETKAVLEYLYCEHDKPTDAQLLVWHDQFKDIDYQEALKAARHLKANLAYAPKVADFWKAIRTLRTSNLPETITWSPAEALANCDSPKYLCRIARSFANRVVPPIDGKRQFSSTEELHKAVEINRREWERAYKEKFQNLQDIVTNNIKIGIPANESIKQLFIEDMHNNNTISNLITQKELENAQF